MGKNVAVFVDVANIFYAAKAAGVDIDYITLLKSATAGRDLVRAYAYTGLDPDNENQRNFHSFLARSGYKVVSKDIRKYGDGKVKANLDIELVVDMMKTARNLDIAIVVSGDGDFAPAIRAVQEMGVRCEVISFRGNTSSDLMDVADLFTDITQLARVEKGTRSGRRVAEDGDLSMTEVPDKQTEGTGRGRGRGRGRERAPEREPVGARSRGRDRSEAAPVRRAPTNGAPIVAMPGERLSRVGDLTEADLAAAEVFTLDDLEPTEGTTGPATERPQLDMDEDGDGAPRRRRRRGGRGRGRGRGRPEGDYADVGSADGDSAEVASDTIGATAAADPDESAADESAAAAAAAAAAGAEVGAEASPRPVRRRRVVDEEVQEAPRGPKPTPFGSVWDSQLGTPNVPSGAALTSLPDDEDFDEPEIPEYLIAERNRGGGQGGRGGGGPRGGRGAYQSAIDRERYGRGGGGGLNRYPDVSGRTSGRETAPGRNDRSYGRADRADGPDRAPAAPRGGGEWSEVPPELEELLRAQVAGKAAPRPASATPVVEPGATSPDGPAEALFDPAVEAAPKPRATRTPRSKASTPGVTATGTATDADAPAAPKRRTTRAKAAAATDAPAIESPADADAPAAPKRRTTRAKAAVADPAATDADAPAAPKRRTARAKAAPTETA